MPKRNQRNARSQAQYRARNTRSSKGKLLSDPAQSAQLLTEQLRTMGLYAASTVGDGNCLFRALSDQYYGTESYHAKLRKDICDWIENHKTRYEPFVEDERGLQVHLQCMRENATYGGHLELSAFAHMMQRNIKVVQPGLVYVIEWDAGGAERPKEPDADDPMLDERERRRLQRDLRRAEKEREVFCGSGSGMDANGAQYGTIYVAYHDYEHFSSIRNLRGPYVGLPCIEELPSSPIAMSSEKKKPQAKSKAKVTSPAKPSRHKSHLSPPEADPPLTPSQIPLPYSRSPSPQIIFPTIASTSSSPPSTATASSHSDTARVSIRISRSPKRSFDESSGSSSSQPMTTSDAVAKRTRSARARLTESQSMDDAELNMDCPTPELSATASTSPSSSSPSPPPQQQQQATLTRRQRKMLGLPKPRPGMVAAARSRGASGKIVIPGGRYRRGAREGDGQEEAEWQRNGTGRLDVRGFKELKI